MNSTLSGKAMINPTIVGCSGKSSLKTFRLCWRHMKRNQLTLNHGLPRPSKLPRLKWHKRAWHQPGGECFEARECFQGGLLFQLKALRVPSDAWFVSGFHHLLCLYLCSSLEFCFHLHCRARRWCLAVLGFVTACVLLGVCFNPRRFGLQDVSVS